MQSQTHNELLKTIIFPKSLNQMKGRLPEPQYSLVNDVLSEQPQLTDKVINKQEKLSQNTKDTGSVIQS